MFKKNWPVIVIFTFVLALFVTNYKGGTWLTGWDNLHPEFDFATNIKRSVFAVWQEYQGLGLLGGMGHASDLARELILLLFSFFLPTPVLRYFWTFLMLFTGGVGAYYLIKFVLCHCEERHDETIPSKLKIALPGKAGLAMTTPFLGSVFYILNLATIQNFYVPYEAFTAHFAFLPWLIFASLRYFLIPNPKSFIFLSVILLFATPHAYVPTLFVVYLLAINILLSVLFFKSPGFEKLKRLIKLYLAIFIINAFWLLPFLYFTFTSSQVNIDARINQMATETVFLQNKEFGNVFDVIQLKGFWFNNVDPNRSGTFEYMLAPWREHLKNPIINSLSFIFFTIICFGIVYCLKKRKSILAAFFFLFVFSFTMLAISAPPFSWINNIFREIPLFNQAFRFPFTKFSTLASLTYAIFFSIGMQVIGNFAQNYFKKGKVIFYILFMGLLVIFIFPAFKGNFFYSKERLSIPKEYFDLFEFFKNQDKNARIANFPQYTFWGWSFYKWGYGGSGFLWYGIEQPILDRAFDVWSEENEGYYYEIYYAVYSNNLNLLESLLEKYNIKWILIDDNIRSYSNQKQVYFTKLKDILERSKKTSLAASFEKIKIYKVNLEETSKNYVSILQNLPVIEPSYKWNNYDLGYAENGNYISNNSQLLTFNSQLSYYPFRSLFSGKTQDLLEFKVEDRGDYFSFISKAPKELNGSTLLLPSFYEEELAELDANNPENRTLRYPSVFIDNEPIFIEPKETDVTLKIDAEELPEKELSIANGIAMPFFEKGILEVRIPKIKGLYSFDNNINVKKFTALKSKPCNPFNVGEYKYSPVVENGKYFLNFQSFNSSNCLEIDLSDLSHRLGYLLSIESKFIQGKSMLFAVINNDSQRSEIETYLPNKKQVVNSYFIVPPMAKYGLGYKLYFDNISMGGVKTVNNLGKITINPIPYRFLTSLKIINIRSGLKNSELINDKEYKVEHPNPSFYKIESNKEKALYLKNSILVLSQSYDKGWKAYQVQSSKFKVQSWLNETFPFLFGEKIEDHILVNNWANGWNIQDQKSNIKDQKQIIIVFWPQYLQYAGFGLLFIAFFATLKWKGRLLN